MTINSDEAVVSAEQLRAQLTDILSLESVTVDKQHPEIMIFRGQLLLDSEIAFAQVRSRFATLQYTPHFARNRNQDVITALPGIIQVRPSNPWINLILFLLTVASTIYTGGQSLNGFVLKDGILFSASLLLILGAHELGHYFMARFHGEPATLPYFIPMPFSLGGTMGAFIQMKAPFVTRKAIFDVGLAGPLAGLIFAVPLLFVGLFMSDVKTFQEIERTVAEARKTNPNIGTYSEGNSLLYAATKYTIFGRWLPNQLEDVWLSPIASAAWLGLLVTSLNLLPAGQLDGGHVAYALLGERAGLLSRATIVGLLLLGAGLYLWGTGFDGWFIWAVLIYLLGVRHPPPLNDIAAIGARRKIIGVLSWVLFILIFVPLPISVSLP